MTPSNIVCREVAFGSDEYRATIKLRYRVLREPLGLNYSPEQLAAESDSHHLAAYQGDDLVACLVLKPSLDSQVVMRQVAVSPDRQGQGLGRVIIGFAESWAKQKGYTSIYLHARDTAVPFYEKLGYRKFGEPFEEIGLSHSEMSKDLG